MQVMAEKNITFQDKIIMVANELRKIGLPKKAWTLGRTS